MSLVSVETDERQVTVSEAASILELSPSRVRTWVAVDTLPHSRTSRGAIIIPLREILALRTARHDRARRTSATRRHLHLVVDNT